VFLNVHTAAISRLRGSDGGEWSGTQTSHVPFLHSSCLDNAGEAASTSGPSTWRVSRWAGRGIMSLVSPGPPHLPWDPLGTLPSLHTHPSRAGFQQSGLELGMGGKKAGAWL
jgi:hypothetical protein